MQYSAGEREALAVIFALRNFCLLLLLTETFILLTDQQALTSPFARKGIHGRLARWIDFLAEYNFEFHYCSGSSNKVADLLSRIRTGEREESECDEGNLVCVMNVTPVKEWDLEHLLQEVVSLLSDQTMEGKESWKWATTRRRALKFVWWKGHLYRKVTIWLSLSRDPNEQPFYVPCTTIWATEM